MPRIKSKPTRSLAPSDVLLSDILSSWYSAPKKKSTAIQFDLIDRLFESYANKSSGLIEPEGIEALCKDVHVDSKDVRMLILAWKMKAEKQGFFPRTTFLLFDALTRSNHNPLILLNDKPLMSSSNEWRRGLKCLGADTIAKLRKEIDVIEIKVMLPESFEDFYSYAFEYNLIEDKQRTVDIETACELLNVVLRLIFPTQVDLLVEYLKIQNEYGALNRDHWRSFFRFFREISIRDLQSYDSNQAWPVIIDNFVEWLKEKEKKV